MSKQIHLGKLIETRMEKTGMSVTGLARALNTTRQNVYNIFERSSIDTRLIEKIFYALKYDFFALLSASVQKSHPDIITETPIPDHEELIKHQQEVQHLKDYINDLRSLNTLLKEKVASLSLQEVKESIDKQLRIVSETLEEILEQNKRHSAFQKKGKVKSV